MKSASHPLTQAVIQQIVKDEAPHGRLGWMLLEWAQDRLDDPARIHLAATATDALRTYEPYWKRLRSTVHEGRTTEGFLLAHVRDLGWMESSAYAATAREAIRNDVVAPLAQHGILVPEAEIYRLLA